jgi:hypothetical protein
MKSGGTLAIAMHDLIVDWEGKVFANKHNGVFPKALFSPSRWNEAAASVFVRAKGDGAPKLSPGFNVVVVGVASEAAYEKLLKGSLEFAWGVLEAVVVLLG